jgi:hypothetical protein
MKNEILLLLEGRRGEERRICEFGFRMREKWRRWDVI